MGRLMMYSPEVRERAVRLVLEHRGGAPFGVGGDLFDSGKVRVFVGDAAQMGSAG